MWKLPVSLLSLSLGIWFLKLALNEIREKDVLTTTLTSYILSGVTLVVGGVALLLMLLDQ
jgi:uncharacterized membrane protein YidH (DUF202 family)